ncbi:SMR family transporter [Vibrio panuliri]|uniref:Quaternary ammonium transporter n=1 Tax=Vibrio panuliri TaxID=1381081 RepID=A0ABX3FS26_9VIBR|nr:SMR family transporter [Vibrio panuliri]KAB1457979.1 QacE family quaternary ammonium compound efflux SMR transporter [Vibrio panuliri]OLQ96585.1 quaternary ammonium transporter [Vibrio panuliri]
MAYLALAILSEVVATTLLPLTQAFTRLAPSVGCIAGYIAAFYFLSLATAAGMNSATAYAIWCGVGIVLLALVQALIGNVPNVATVIGMLLIVTGVTVINLAGSVSH